MRYVNAHFTMVDGDMVCFVCDTDNYMLILYLHPERLFNKFNFLQPKLFSFTCLLCTLHAMLFYLDFYYT